MHNGVVLGDCRTVLANMESASVDAVVTDPPYALTSKRGGATGFMGASWDTAHVAHDSAFWAEVRRVAKPGAFLLAFAGTRTYHRLACAIEDAGWELRDMLMWLYGSGFPKSKSCLKPAQEPIVLAKAPGPLQPLQIDACRVAMGGEVIARDFDAQQDSGYGYCRPTPARQGQWTNTAGRWPPNTLFSHVGGPDGCQPAGVRRVRGNDRAHKTRPGVSHPERGWRYVSSGAGWSRGDADGYETVDAWACVDGCPVAELDRQASYSSERPRTLQRNGARQMDGWGLDAPSQGTVHGDAGGKSRFFPTFPGPDPEDAVPFRYCSKASRRDRNAGCEDLAASPERNYAGGPLNRPEHACSDGAHRTGARVPRGNTHSTVKPTALMAWLCTLVTPEGGTVLDCFAGSGSTGVACVREGFGFIGIEQSVEYAAIARARIAHEQDRHAGPLFAACARSV